MADIRNYPNGKENKKLAGSFQKNGLKLVKSEDEDSFQKKLHKHRLTFFYRILLFLIIIGSIVAIAVVQYNNRIYADYEITKTANYSGAAGVKNIRLGDKVLTYSKDGAYCTDSDGTVLWNQTYEMQSPMVKVCKDTVAIADYNGGTIYIWNTKKQLGTISTNLPIRNISVAANGIVAAALDDVDVTWIYLYSTMGEELVQFHTSMDKTGYPVSFCLSEDGMMCVVSYIYVDSGTVKSSVAFYNFDEYGKNQSDNLVGGFDYTDTIVPYTQYMNRTSLFAVGDDCLMIYGGSQKPEQKAVYYFDSDIRSIFYNEEYIGVVFYEESSEGRYRLEVYNTAGKHTLTKYFNVDYTDIVFKDEEIIIYNEDECMICTGKGVNKYNGQFKRPVSLLIPQKANYQYILLLEEALETIQLK